MQAHNGIITGDLRVIGEIRGRLSKKITFTGGQTGSYDGSSDLSIAIPTSLPASDVSSWAKASTKPTYTASEVGALPDTTKYAGSGSVGGPASKVSISNGSGNTWRSLLVTDGSNGVYSLPSMFANYANPGLKFIAGNKDVFIHFLYDDSNQTNSWRLGYLGTGSSDANLLAFLTSGSGTTFSNAFTISNENKLSTFYGNVVPDTTNVRSLGTDSLKWKEVRATTFYGDLSGTATKATQDGDGNTITTKYVTIDTEQTVSGAKTFSSLIKADGNIKTDSLVNEGWCHRIDFGKKSFDHMDFYEYGGVYNFYKNESVSSASSATLLGKITTNGWEGNVKGTLNGKKIVWSGRKAVSTDYVPAWSADGSEISYRSVAEQKALLGITDKKTSSADTSSKIYLVGATTQSADGQTTYSDDEVYATNGKLSAKSVEVATAMQMNYNSTYKYISFDFV